MQSNNIIKVLESEEAQSFIRSHINDDLAEVALKSTKNNDFNVAECLQLIKIYKKAKKKLPTYWEHLLALDERAYAQCTSELVARYKASFLFGGKLLDITGGIGIDSLFLSERYETVIVLERNEELHTLASFNIARLGVGNVSRLHTSAREYFQSSDEYFDLIYIDPDRRSEFGRSVALEHLSPNVPELMSILTQKANSVYIKLSPLFDIDEVYRCFEHVKSVYILAERGEIKEVGVLLDFSLESNKNTIRLVDVVYGFDRTLQGDKYKGAFTTDEELAYLHTPIALVAKSRSANYFLEGKRVAKHADFELYFAHDVSIEGFRTFEIVAKSGLAYKKVAKMLASSNVSQCNIVLKGTKQKVSDWHKKLKTKDGGVYYLFLLFGKKKEAILARATF